MTQQVTPTAAEQKVKKLEALMKTVLDHPDNKIISMHRLALEIELHGLEGAMKRVLA